MLEKHITATTSHKQHDDFNSSSPEPRLKIKISRLKDGSASFSLHNGFNIPDNSTRLDNRNNCNHSQDDDDDGDETEDDYNNQSDYNNAPKRSRLDVQELAIHQQNGDHKHHDERGKYSDKENKIALRSRISRNKIGDDSSDASKIKACQRNLSGKKSVGCSTEGDLLGPCQPGTLIKLPGLVWSESSENGMLLFKTLWKDKPFVGMLMEVGQGEEWSISKSRIFASCPGSRYKRKCKKPREFRYVDSWQKKNKNIRFKAKSCTGSSRNCSEDSRSTNEDETTLDRNQYLTCHFNGCRKKFVNETAKGFHISHAHPTSQVKEEDDLKMSRKRNGNIDFGGRLFRNSFSTRRKDRIKSAVSECSTASEVFDRKRRACQSSDDDSTNLSSTTSMTSFATISDGIQTGQHDRNTRPIPVEDISDDDDDDDDDDVEIHDRVGRHHTFYASTLNPTSLVIRRAVKTSDRKDDVRDRSVDDCDDDGLTRRDSEKEFESSSEPRDVRIQAVITSSGSVSSLTSTSFASPTSDGSSRPRHLEASESSARSPNPLVPAPSWLDHYPHSISAALTMSLLSMSKSPPSALMPDSQPPTEKLDEHLLLTSASKDEETSKHSIDDSPATVTAEFCDVGVPTDLSPADATTPTNQDSLLIDFTSQDDNVPSISDEESDSLDDTKASCISPVYSDISDTVDQTPLFANTSRVIDAKTPPPVADSYFVNQYESLPKAAMQSEDTKAADWPTSEENVESGVYFDGYTSYLQQILCNKEKFYMSLAFGSPSNSPQRFHPGHISVSPVSETSKASTSPDHDADT